MIKKLLNNLSYIILGLIAGTALIASAATLQGYQGGTGIATSSGTVGNFLRVTSTTPFLTYDLNGTSSAGGVTSLNGSTSSTQTFATSGPLLSVATQNGVHTFTTLATSSLGLQGAFTTVPYASTTGVQNALTFPLAFSSTTHLGASSPLSISGTNVIFSGSLDYASTTNVQKTISFPIPVASTSLTAGSNIIINGNIISAATSTGGTPGGTSTQVQFNNGGSFGGDSGLTYSSSSVGLIIGTNTYSGQPTYGSSTSVDSGAGVTNFSTSFSSGNKSNGMLVAVISNVTNGNEVNMTASYGGSPMTLVNNFSANSIRSYTFVLPNPASGANNLVATSTGSITFDDTIAYYYNVLQSNAVSDFATSTATTGGATTLGVTVTPTATSSLVMGAFRGFAGGTTAGTNTTMRLSQTAYFAWMEATSSTSGATTINANFSSAGGNWNALALKPAAATYNLQVNPGSKATVVIGANGFPGCLALGQSDGSAGLNYITALNGVLTATTTIPSVCK